MFLFFYILIFDIIDKMKEGFEMSYKALYRLYRPTNFNDVSGQEVIVKTLRNAVNNNRIAHAYLLCGPRGTGKTSLAKILAKAVNCTGEDKPCCQCDNCLSFEEGNHPDVIEIDAASNNGVDEVRNLIDKVKYAPIVGKYKVYIIDEVHMMTQGAYNALLKTIEEPPKHILFIFATTEPHKVLTTIISRCQRFDFTRVSNNDIIDRLSYICQSSNIKYEKGVLETIAALSNGGLRDALSILDQCSAFEMDTIKKEDIFKIYGIVTTMDKIKLLQIVKSGNTSLLMKQLDTFDHIGIDIKRLTTDLIDLLKESIIFEYSSDSSLLINATTNEVKLLNDIFTPKEALLIIDILLETFEKFRISTNIKAYLEIAFLKIMTDVSRETNQNIKNIEVEELHSTIEEKVQVVEEDIITMTQIDFEEETEVIEEKSQSILKENKYDDFISVKDDYIIRLLVSANKQEKAEDKQLVKNINLYRNQIEYARFANLLQDIDIVASGKGFMIIRTSTQIIANEINELDEKNKFTPFLNKVMNKNKKVFAITNIQYERIIETFKIQNRNGSLPEPIEIVFEKEKKQTVNDKLEILFGNNVEIKE